MADFPLSANVLKSLLSLEQGGGKCRLPFVLLLLRNLPDLLLLAHLDCLKEYSTFPSAIALPPKVLTSGSFLWFPSAPAVSQVPGTVRFIKAAIVLSSPRLSPDSPPLPSSQGALHASFTPSESLPGSPALSCGSSHGSWPSLPPGPEALPLLLICPVPGFGHHHVHVTASPLSSSPAALLFFLMPRCRQVRRLAGVTADCS